MGCYSHYSLYEDFRILADFAPIPKGGLPRLLADIHRQLGIGRRCAGIDSGAIHPDGSQLNLRIGLGDTRFTLILLTRQAVATHAVELLSEGNLKSAEKARTALRK